MKKIALLAFLCTISACTSKKAILQVKNYEPTWESLAQYDQTAKWFKDAKFGIYAHWGVLSVPAYANDWYPRNMHIEGTDENKHQIETYGPLSKFGYHDFVPMFKAQQFNADEWAGLMVQAGAKFGGIVAEHHDGWSNWASKLNPWNSMDKGPHRDLVGELATAIKGHGLKFVTSFHKDRNLQLFQNESENWLDDTSYFPYNPDMATSSTDPEISIMYGNIVKEGFYRLWLGELEELIDNYSPDLIYFDSKMTKIPETYKQQFLAYYFNHSVAKKKQVVVTHKEGELPKTVSLEDLEKGRMNRITPEFWLTDETVSEGSWSYTDTMGLKTADEIIDLLADIISKNGTLMLNISPKADGSIPQNQKDILLTIGHWLKQNGEAVYATRTWETFGEGPARQDKGGMFVDKVNYTSKDIRYTRKGNNIYAIVLGWPGDNKKVLLQAFSGKMLDVVPEIKSVTILSTGQKCSFNQDDTGLYIITPKNKVDDKAFVFKIETR
ncbi:alpha-L-fucosidase [Flavobacterium rhizosphaerae]|uniref:alpha-L-fucosidase n=1 Tax=Flavobacterium rhizosphaerae TaxID=3163298 RepID=A0ABW8YTB7_9FLAO